MSALLKSDSGEDRQILAESQHEISGRHARLEDLGHSGWLYITDTSSPVVVGDCWVFNRIQAPKQSEIAHYRTASPPAIEGYAHPHAEFKPLPSDTFEIHWSPDGDSVAVLINGVPFGFIPLRVHRGYSKQLLKTGPWGHVWDEELYQELFGESGWSESIPSFF